MGSPLSWLWITIPALLLETLLITGCSWSTHSTTLSKDGPNAGQVIYRISEETAFTVALDAYAVLYPKQAWTTLLMAGDVDTALTKIGARTSGAIDFL